MIYLFVLDDSLTRDSPRGPKNYLNVMNHCRFKPASNFILLIVPRRYFCCGSFCFMSWCLKFLCCWLLMYVFIFLVKFR